jgi:succinoglycan biosynthesis transport protein ExoP
MSELAPYGLRLPSPASQDSAGVLVESSAEGHERSSLPLYWSIIRKRQALIATVFLGTLLATALALSLMNSVYTAETTLLLERHTPQVLEFREVLAEPQGPEQDFYKTQYEILKSRTLAARVVREQNLETSPVFADAGHRTAAVARLWAHAKRWATQQAWIRPLFPPPSRPGGEGPLAVKPELIDIYLNMLRIIPTQRTKLVKIVFETPDPKLSALLANAHAQAYIRRGIELRTQTNEEAQRFLEGKLVELKARVEASEAALNRYRRNRGIISLEEKENIVVERLADLNKRLTEGEADRIALEGQVRLIRGGTYDAIPAVINNPLIQTLSAESARLEGQYAHLSTQFKPGYPRLDQLKAQVDDTQRRLWEEVRRVVRGLESAYQAAITKEKQLRDAMEKQKTAALRLKDASVDYAILAREVDTNRQLYESVLQRMKEMGVAAELRASNVFVIDAAEAPRTASKPKIAQSLLLAMVLGSIGGLVFAFLMEYLDHTFKTPEEVERYLRLPNLSVVPDFLGLDWRRYAPQASPYATRQLPSPGTAGEELGLVLSRHPLSLVTEAYRTLRTAILLSRAGEPPRTILFTSAMHGEGKTAAVINTAIVFAQMGVRILVIDADLRRSRCHEILGMNRGFGLTEMLTGLEGLHELIRVTHIPDLFFLSSGAMPPNPPDLVGSKKMQDTLATLREQYDYILIDSPPVVPVSDAVLLSALVEGVVLVVNSQETPKPGVREAYARLRYARANIIGTILNRADIRNGNSAYYY